VWIVVYNGFARFAQLRCCCTPLVRVAYSRPTDWDKTTVLLVAEAPTCMAAWSSIHCWWPPAMKSHQLAGSSNASNTHASLYRSVYCCFFTVMVGQICACVDWDMCGVDWRQSTDWLVFGCRVVDHTGLAWGCSDKAWCYSQIYTSVNGEQCANYHVVEQCKISAHFHCHRWV